MYVPNTTKFRQNNGIWQFWEQQLIQTSLRDHEIVHMLNILDIFPTTKLNLIRVVIFYINLKL